MRTKTAVRRHIATLAKTSKGKTRQLRKAMNMILSAAFGKAKVSFDDRKGATWSKAQTLYVTKGLGAVKKFLK
jgi:hypothetical protein